MDELTKRRLAHNEELFREVNIERERAHLDARDGELTFVCECSSQRCSGRIRLSAASYRRIAEERDRRLPAEAVSPRSERDRGVLEPDAPRPAGRLHGALLFRAGLAHVKYVSRSTWSRFGRGYDRGRGTRTSSACAR